VATTASAPAHSHLPALSSSLDSADSDDDGLTIPITPRIANPRPDPRRNPSSIESRTSRGREKHITPVDLEKMVTTITATKDLEPLEISMPTLTPTTRPIPPTPSTPTQSSLPKLELTSAQSPLRPIPVEEDEEEDEEPTPSASASHATLLESSASTVDTTGSNESKSSQTVGSQESSSTEMSTHSIVRGFVPGGAPSSYRSQTNLAAQPTPILKTSSFRQQVPKKKGPMFTIGTSSGEDESSLESHMHRSVLSDSLRRPTSYTSDCGKKQTSFKDEVSVGHAAALRHSSVFESDDEDEDVSESAIEDDDDSSDWEDSDDGGSGPSSVNESNLFQRVDSRPDLTSRRSLLTTLMHEPDRAKALANAASRSSPAIRRSRTSTPNGPSVAASPEAGSNLHAAMQNMTRSKPIIMTTSNTHQQLALSPRTTRRNMLSTELTESLRKNLLWERQHKSTGNLAAMKRRHTSTDVKNLKQHPEPAPMLTGGKFSNDYFHAGLGEYHAKGW
jgi:hypothetical protein